MLHAINDMNNFNFSPCMVSGLNWPTFLQEEKCTSIIYFYLKLNSLSLFSVINMYIMYGKIYNSYKNNSALELIVEESQEHNNVKEEDVSEFERNLRI